MGTNNQSGANVNNSSTTQTNHTGTFFHISDFEANSILEMAHNLKGEKALDEVGFVLATNGDNDFKGDAARSLLRFYSNVCTLVAMLHKAFGIEAEDDI